MDKCTLRSESFLTVLTLENIIVIIIIIIIIIIIFPIFFGQRHIKSREPLAIIMIVAIGGREVCRSGEILIVVAIGTHGASGAQDLMQGWIQPQGSVGADALIGLSGGGEKLSGPHEGNLPRGCIRCSIGLVGDGKVLFRRR